MTFLRVTGKNQLPTAMQAEGQQLNAYGTHESVKRAWLKRARRASAKIGAKELMHMQVLRNRAAAEWRQMRKRNPTKYRAMRRKEVRLGLNWAGAGGIDLEAARKKKKSPVMREVMDLWKEGKLHSGRKGKGKKAKKGPIIPPGPEGQEQAIAIGLSKMRHGGTCRPK